MTTEIRWLPKGWSERKLGDITERINPGFPSGKHNKAGVGVPHLRPMNVSRLGNIDLTDLKYVENDSFEALTKGDVLFNNTNSPALVGKTALIQQDAGWAYSNHMTRIRVDRSLANPAWVAYYLHTLFLQGFFRSHCKHHVNQASIGTNFLTNKVSLPMPPLPEQRRIVAKIEQLFSKLDTGVDSLKKAKALLKAYRKAVLKAAFTGVLSYGASASAETLSSKQADALSPGPLRGELPGSWSITTIGRISRRIQYGYTEKAVKKPVGPKFLRISDIQEGTVDWHSVPFCRIDSDEKSKYRLMPGDIVFARTGATVGKSYLIPHSIPEAVFASYLIRIVPGVAVLNRFLAYFFQSSAYWRQIRQGAAGIGQPNVNSKKLAALELPLPPIPQQRWIVDEVDRLFSVCDRLEGELNSFCLKSDEFRSSVLLRAFAGELVT